MVQEELLRNALTKSSTFPCNSLESIPEYVARRYAQLLDKESERLFGTEDSMKLDIWDLISRSNGFVENVITSNSQTVKVGSPSLSSRDPLCRFVFAHAKNSRAKLFVTKQVLLYIFSYHQVMASYIDFIVPFGQQHHAKDNHFSGLKCDSRLTSGSSSCKSEVLGRSGNDYRMCYNFKSVESSASQINWPWSIRQAAIYHQFDVEEGRTLWIVVKGDQLLKDRIKDLTRQTEVQSEGSAAFAHNASAQFIQSLHVHLLIFEWCIEDWRWYLNFVEEEQAWTKNALTMRFDKPREPAKPKMKKKPTSLGFARRTLSNLSQRVQSATGTLIPKNPERILLETIGEQPMFEPNMDNKDMFKFDDLQRINHYEEKVNEIIQTITSNRRILGGVKKYYEDMFVSKEFPEIVNKDASQEFRVFQDTTSTYINDLEIQLERAQTMSTMLGNRKGLLNGILEYSNMEANKFFTREAAASTRKMEHMTEEMNSIAKRTKQQSVSMHVITVVTLLFLPGTFISTIMSTDIIKFPKNEDTNLYQKNFSSEALRMYLSITIPLMIVTLTGWFCVYWCVHRRQAARDARKRWEIQEKREEIV